MNKLFFTITGILMFSILSGCFVSSSVRNANNTPVVALKHEFTEAEPQLNISIRIFEPNVDENSKAVKKGLVLPAIRTSESYYFPHTLKTVLENSGNWGNVRIVPADASPYEIDVNGLIIRSDGEQLAMRVIVKDATGKTWFKKTYKQNASRFSYSVSAQTRYVDVMASVYAEIANDILLYRLKQTPEKLKRIQQTAQIQFAVDFLPEKYREYLKVSRKGHKKLVRLPAENADMFKYIQTIQDRDNIYIDILDHYYADYANKMKPAYTDWRKYSFEEIIAYKERKRESVLSGLLSVASIVAGIMSSESSSRIARTSGSIGIIAGMTGIQSSIAAGKEAKLHLESIKEHGFGFNAEIEPRTLKLQDQIVTLSGSVTEQYEAWRDLLREIYKNETTKSTTE